MLTLNQKRKIRLELELQKLNINGYRYLLRGYKGIEILTETEFETVDTKFNKYVLLAYTDNENKYSVHQIINRKNEQGYTEKFYVQNLNF